MDKRNKTREASIRVINFTLNETESKCADEFYKKHKDCCSKLTRKRFFSSTGGELSYIITPTGLGNCITIRCNSCGEEKEITDTSNW